MRESTRARTRGRAIALVAGLVAGLVVACASAVPRGPEEAFDRLRIAVAGGDLRLLYDALDTESRWAVDTIWKYQRDAAALVETLPAEARARELPRLEAARGAATSREYFAVMPGLGTPLASLGGGVTGLGTRARVERQGDRATVHTSTGLAIPLAAGKDGAWGYAGLQAELVRRRDAAANDLERLKADAAVLAR